MSSLREQLIQLEQDMFDAIRTRDEAALNRLLSPDFELHMPGAAAVPRTAFIASVLAIPGTVLEVSSDDTEARLLGDEIGVLTGHQRARVRLPNGDTVTQIGAFTDVARRKEGRWLMVHAYNVNVSETGDQPTPQRRP